MSIAKIDIKHGTPAIEINDESFSLMAMTTRIGDEEYIHLMLNLQKMSEKYKNDIKVSIIFDKDMLTNYKDSPIDDGPELFQKLYNERTQLY